MAGLCLSLSPSRTLSLACSVKSTPVTRYPAHLAARSTGARCDASRKEGEAVRGASTASGAARVMASTATLHTLLLAASVRAEDVPSDLGEVVAVTEQVPGWIPIFILTLPVIAYGGFTVFREKVGNFVPYSLWGINNGMFEYEGESKSWASGLHLPGCSNNHYCEFVHYPRFQSEFQALIVTHGLTLSSCL